MFWKKVLRVHTEGKINISEKVLNGKFPGIGTNKQCNQNNPWLRNELYWRWLQYVHAIHPGIKQSWTEEDESDACVVIKIELQGSTLQVISSKE